MQIHNILQKNYTFNEKVYQLKLPLNIDCIIPENDSVRYNLKKELRTSNFLTLVQQLLHSKEGKRKRNLRYPTFA